MFQHSTTYSSFFLINIIILTVISSASVEELLKKGTSELSQGKFQEAISFYTEAIDTDPKNHLSYYRRATAYLALGKVKTSISDLESVLELNYLYLPARKQLGNALIKLGHLDEAKKNFKLLENEPEGKEKLNYIENLIDIFQDVKDSHINQECKANLKKLDDLVEDMPLFEDLRITRAECLFQLGEFNRGIQDMRHSVHLVNDNRKGLLELSILMYNYGLALQAIEEVRQCLKLDQDDKACHKHYKMLKKLVKAITKTEESMESSDWNGCVKHSKKVIELEPEKDSYVTQAKVHLCKCYSKIGSEEAIEMCKTVIEKYPDNTDYRLNLAEAYLSNDNFDESIGEYQKILEYDRSNHQAREGMEKAQRMKKKASSRNYYKILGVPKNAKKKEIIKAYRKLAAEWHPDRFEEKDKKNAEKKFIDITDSKEVLTDPEKRAQFDSGTDPLDPQNGGSGHSFQRGGHPFAQNFHFQGFNPFDDGNFEFHFS